MGQVGVTADVEIADARRAAAVRTAAIAAAVPLAVAVSGAGVGQIRLSELRKSHGTEKETLRTMTHTHTMNGTLSHLRNQIAKKKTRSISSSAGHEAKFGCFFYGSSSFAFEAVKLAKIAPKLFAAEKKNVKATPVRPDER